MSPKKKVEREELTFKALLSAFLLIAEWVSYKNRMLSEPKLSLKYLRSSNHLFDDCKPLTLLMFSFAINSSKHVWVEVLHLKTLGL